MARIPLVHLAHARSGDKGDTANIGLIAYDPDHYALLREQVTAERVREHLTPFVRGDVERFELPRLAAFNFVLREALGGGGTLSLRTDSQGKVLSTALLRMEVDVPDEMASAARDRGRVPSGWEPSLTPRPTTTGGPRRGVRP